MLRTYDHCAVTRGFAAILLGLLLSCGDDSPLKPPIQRDPRALVVAPDGTGEFPTIQAAINASQAGDTVLLENGRYQGNGNRDLVIDTHPISIMSRSQQPANCIIDCDGSPGEPHRGLSVGEEQQGTTIENVTIEDGFAIGGGGAVRCEVGSTPVFRGVVFRSHRVAAIRTDGASPTFISCIFRNNIDGASYLSGGAPIFEACTFVDNYSADSGGAIVFSASDVVVDSCTFSRNSAFFGGGAVYGISGSLVATNCSFYDNIAGYHGGALYTSDTDLDMSRCDFVGNTASGKGGAVWCTSQSVGVFDDCLFYDNAAENGGALLASSSLVTFQRTIVAANMVGHALECDSLAGPSSIALTCSDLYANETGDWTSCVASQAGVEGNIASDPLFCDPQLRDFRLMSNSPCAPPISTCGRMGSSNSTCTVSDNEKSSVSRSRKLRYRGTDF